jgi:DNA-binding GntR family transcriptional regulator
MARQKTTNTPDLSALLTPQTPIMVAVEHSILRAHKWSHAAAPVAEQIAVRLAGVITMDLIHAGQRLLEKDISEVLHVSRAPVREALRILERERLVEFQSRRGAIVTAPDAKDLRDIYVVRSALYAIFLRQLMEKRPADVDAVFERHMPKIMAAAEQSVDDYTLQSFLLNIALLDLSENKLISDLLASISLRTLRYVRLGLAEDPDRIATAVKSWRALQRAVARRDIDEVLQMAGRRIDASRDAAVRAIVAPSAAASPVSRKAASSPARSRPSVPSRRPSAPRASRPRLPAP